MMGNPSSVAFLMLMYVAFLLYKCYIGLFLQMFQGSALNILAVFYSFCRFR